ncbi:unnamed protein product [Chrysodeixis includens]|uniref:Transport and Golgi organization protein 2 homolog n=1 Tax=Chrysodeixis includens TaxID=689277 RepID=A0A9P0FWZ9_CHRIL|nr:unnamed protein product [Chrysodeixis includens]
MFPSIICQWCLKIIKKKHITVKKSHCYRPKLQSNLHLMHANPYLKPQGYHNIAIQGCKMCILFLYNGAQDEESDYSLILLSNRDEFYERSSQNMAPWPEDPNIIAGRDLGIEDGGAWLAVSPLRKKIGVLLNLPGPIKENAKSRGKIVVEYVKCEKPVNEYVEDIKDYTKECNEFIFVSAELRCSGTSISSYNNAKDELLSHKDIYLGFGNSLPESPLKKVEAGRNKLMEICAEHKKIKTQRQLVEKLIELLKSEERHLPDHQLEKRRPNVYKELSSIYVCVPQGRYGTRTHTLVLVTKTGHMNIIEITQQAPIDPANPQWFRSEFQYDIEM